MQLLCRSYEGRGDVACPVCGQGFLLYWTRQSPADQPALLSVIVDALSRQHAVHGMAEAHESDPALPTGFPFHALPATQSREVWGYC